MSDHKILPPIPPHTSSSELWKDKVSPRDSPAAPPGLPRSRPQSTFEPRPSRAHPASEPVVSDLDPIVGYRYQAPPPYTVQEGVSVTDRYRGRQRGPVVEEKGKDKGASSEDKEKPTPSAGKATKGTEDKRETGPPEEQPHPQKPASSIPLGKAAVPAAPPPEATPAESTPEPPAPPTPPLAPPLPPSLLYRFPNRPFCPRALGKMAAHPRMLLLASTGGEAFVALPPSYDKAVAIATEKFAVPSTHVVRLSCKAADMQWVGGYASSQDVFIADNDSYHYACAGKYVTRLDVHVYDKNPKPPAPASAAAPAKAAEAAAKPAGAPAAAPTASLTVACTTTTGKTVSVTAGLSGDLKKGPPAGNYLGTLGIEDKTFNQTFTGSQLGPNEVLTKYIIHDKNTARVIFRPRSIRPSVEFLHPEEKSLEVSISVADWTVTAAYPMTSLTPDGNRHRLRWFLKVRPGGIVEDLLTGTVSSGVFLEMLPSPVAKPQSPDPQGPLVPAWPDVNPANAWCLPQSIFIPHIDRILSTLGMPVESRTAMITAWLPGITRHKNIAYRILNRSQIDPTSTLNIIPPPSVILRIFVLFKGIPDSDLKNWETAGILHAEMGLDWREAVGWTPDVQDESLFRAMEYGAMEVHDI